MLLFRQPIDKYGSMYLVFKASRTRCDMWNVWKTKNLLAFVLQNNYAVDENSVIFFLYWRSGPAESESIHFVRWQMKFHRFIHDEIQTPFSLQTRSLKINISIIQGNSKKFDIDVSCIKLSRRFSREILRGQRISKLYWKELYEEVGWDQIWHWYIA